MAEITMTIGPQLTTPKTGAVFNLGVVTITWNTISFNTFGPELDPYWGSDPYSGTLQSFVDLDQVTYEIEYTDKYEKEKTNWYSLTKRVPVTTSTYTWTVGKMIKSGTVRVRIRARNRADESVSNWSIGEEFSINVFELIAPAIVNPVPHILYTDFILIVLDETLTRDTYHQKVRYTLEYSSEKQDTDWTIIASNIPVGQNVIRWNIESVTTSDDYTLKLTARNQSTSCEEADATEPDQIARGFVYDIIIQQSGVFFIDTKPPEVVIEIGENSVITNQLNHIVNIFSEDLTTEVKQIQLRECNSGSSLALGNLEDPISIAVSACIAAASEAARAECDTFDPPLTDSDCDDHVRDKEAEAATQCGSGCESVEALLAGGGNFDTLITDSPVGSASKIQWVFDELDDEGLPVSAIKKIEALLTDTGGNSSLQVRTRVFLPIFKGDENLNDFVIRIEQRDNTLFDGDNTVDTTTATFEVAYLGTDIGSLWVVEPYARLLYTLVDHPNILKLSEFNDTLYLFSYNVSTDEGAAYRHDSTEPTLLKEFTSGLSITTGVHEFGTSLFVGLENGELWEYTGFSFSLKTTFNEAINTLFGDKNYLYIGFQNSSNLVLYNGTTFTTLGIE